MSLIELNQMTGQWVTEGKEEAASVLSNNMMFPRNTFSHRTVRIYGWQSFPTHHAHCTMYSVISVSINEYDDDDDDEWYKTNSISVCWTVYWMQFENKYHRLSCTVNLNISMQRLNFWTTFNTSSAHRCFFTKVFMAFLQFHVTRFAGLFVTRHLTDTFAILSSCVDCYKYSFFPKIPRSISDWNKLKQDVQSKSFIVSFHSALLKISGPVENK